MRDNDKAKTQDVLHENDTTQRSAKWKNSKGLNTWKRMART